MPASDDLVRGLSLSSGATNAGLHQTVIFPAIAGIAWVLEAAAMNLFQNVVSASLDVPFVASGGGLVYYIGYLLIPNGAPALTGDTVELGSEISFPNGVAVTVGDVENANAGSGFLTVTASAYPN